MANKAATKIQHDDKVIEVGDSVSASDVGGEDNFKSLKAAGAIVSKEQYDTLFPEREEGANDAPGTPSNLGEVEGTDLEAKEPTKEGSKSAESTSDTPAKKTAASSQSSGSGSSGSSS